MGKRKALIVGGSNGIGLAIGKKLIDMGYYIEILDKVEPDTFFLEENKFRYTFCDLTDFNESIFVEKSKDEEIEILMITAGIGRLADFQFYHISEIEQIFKVDTISVLKILKIFYERIFSHKVFYTGIISSISGRIISPSASVYASAKAALVRFIESVNIELEVYGINNRILDVCPASFKGSKFYGGENVLYELNDLAENIIDSIFEKKLLYIPNYDERLKDVIEWYNRDSHEYGIYSYEYKKKSGRVDNSNHEKIGYLSGTFDLFHVGHLNLLRRAKQYCDYLIVGVHKSGEWKGKETYIPLDERKEILTACKYVDKVVDSCMEDSDAWEKWKYNYLFVGSDYKDTERFNRYENFFKDKGVSIIYFPYTKHISSTKIRNTVSKL